MSDGWMIVNNELERVWKEVLMAWLDYCAVIFLEKLRKTTVNFSQDTWCPIWDLNEAPPEHKSEALSRLLIC
jgi:hypothetical protein